jgi:hypothetical protein
MKSHLGPRVFVRFKILFDDNCNERYVTPISSDSLYQTEVVTAHLPHHVFVSEVLLTKCAVLWSHLSMS